MTPTVFVKVESIKVFPLNVHTVIGSGMPTESHCRKTSRLHGTRIARPNEAIRAGTGTNGKKHVRELKNLERDKKGIEMWVT